MDFISDVAFPLPFAVISDMLGVPSSDAEQLRDWSYTVTKGPAPLVTDEQLLAAARAEGRWPTTCGRRSIGSGPSPTTTC